MATGSFAVISEGITYISQSFIRHMSTNKNGKFAYHLLESVTSVDELKSAIKFFHNKFFHGDCVTNLMAVPDSPGFIAGNFSDIYSSNYYYIKNLDNKEHHILDKYGVAHTIFPEEIQIWHDKEHEVLCENELKLSNSEKENWDFKKQNHCDLTPMCFRYVGNSHEAIIVKAVVNEIIRNVRMKLETSHKKTYSKFVCVYPNFSLDTEGLFTYNNNEFVATWNKNTESDLQVESINPITLQLLSKILSECINLL